MKYMQNGRRKVVQGPNWPSKASLKTDLSQRDTDGHAIFQNLKIRFKTGFWVPRRAFKPFSLTIHSYIHKTNFIPSFHR